ncbi:MAG: GumC family protein [Edaphobacter sp.]
MPLSAEDDAENRTTWADLGTLLLRYRKVILITFVSVILGAYATLQFMTEQYESEASLLVMLGRENVELPITVQQAGLVATGIRPEELNSEIQILHSRRLIEEVVDELGPKAFAFAPPRPHGIVQTARFYFKLSARWCKHRYDDVLILLNLKKRLTDRQAAIALLDGAIDGTPEKGSDVIALTVRLPSATLALQVEQTLLKRYFELRTSLRRTPLEQQFFRQQLRDQGAKLKALEDHRADIIATYNLSSLPDQRALLLKQRTDLETQTINDRSSDARLAQEQSVMRSELPKLTESIPSSTEQSLNPEVRAYMDRLSELQVERVKLAGKYQPKAEPLKRVDDEIASIEDKLKQSSPTVLGSVIDKSNPVKQQFVQSTATNDVILAGLQAEQKALQGPIQATARQLVALNEGEQKLTDVDRELKLVEDSYLDFAKRDREATLHTELDDTHLQNVAVVSPPTEPFQPVSPKKLLIMAISIPMGLLFGVVLALLLHYMDDTIHDERDLVAVEGAEFLGHFREPLDPGELAVRLTQRK